MECLFLVKDLGFEDQNSRVRVNEGFRQHSRMKCEFKACNGS